MAIQIRTSLDEHDVGDSFVPHRPARPDKAEGGRAFVLKSDYSPAGDQPTAIRELVEAAAQGEKDQVLLGVTGSGKTFTMAKVIEALQRPALILAPNKILAAQLYGEFKSYFPDNAVEFFVSYYDYYQPEAYVPRSDTYIEKESSVNEAIDRMRHSATRSLLERDDVIIVASVSCLYGIGSTCEHDRRIGGTDFLICDGEGGRRQAAAALELRCTGAQRGVGGGRIEHRTGVDRFHVAVRCGALLALGRVTRCAGLFCLHGVPAESEDFVIAML